MDLSNHHFPIFIAMLADVTGSNTLHGRPVASLRIEGTIVSTKKKSNKISFVLDDGSGTITVTTGKFVSKTELSKLQIGKTFAVVGKYQSCFKMKASNLFELSCSTSQPLHCARIASFWQPTKE